ncbi:hypothetical protein HK105_206150 [Polyrhizophydium stewartii]|uniref:Uncharacterized protein n=1 Tax=Polyrhizophydium stewartii TaxID=2732419 RepID=A0ABR4N4B4_9FUNG
MPPAAGSPTPPPRYEHAAALCRRAAAWGAAPRLLVLFGAAPDGPLSDVWALDLDAMTWERLDPAGSRPPPRTLHSVAVVRAAPAPPAADSVTATAKPLAPGPRVPAGDRLFVFGGGAQMSSPVADQRTYCLDLERLAWVVVHCPRDGVCSPAPRLGHSLTAVGSLVVMFGGLDGDRILDELWAFDMVSFRWFQPPVDGPRPSGRCAHTATAIGSSIVVIGGMVRNPSPAVADDVWVLDTVTWSWARQNPAFVPPEAPRPRLDHDACAIPSSEGSGKESIVVFGGMDLVNTFNDVFEYIVELD